MQFMLSGFVMTSGKLACCSCLEVADACKRHQFAKPNTTGTLLPDLIDGGLGQPYVLQGYHGDTSKMFMVGNVSEKARDLCTVTKHSLDEAIKICGPGVPIKEIGRVRGDGPFSINFQYMYRGAPW